MEVSNSNRNPVSRGFRRLFQLKSASNQVDAHGLTSDSFSIMSEKGTRAPVVSIIKKVRRSFSKATRATRPIQLDGPISQVVEPTLPPPEAEAAPKAVAAACRNILQLPVEIVYMIGQKLCLEDRLILSLGCKALRAMFGDAAMGESYEPDKQKIAERLERDLSRFYTYCPTCEKLHPNIRNRDERYKYPESVGNVGCDAEEFVFRPNRTWKEGSAFLSYKDARMLANYRRYGAGSGMSPAEFNHETGWVQRDAFHWNNHLEVKFIRGSQHLMLRSTFYILGPEKVPMSLNRVLSTRGHFLCEHAGMLDRVDAVPTLGMFRNAAANLTRYGFETPVGCAKCYTDWGFEVLDLEEIENRDAPGDSGEAENLDDVGGSGEAENLDEKPILVIAQTYHLIQDVYSDYEYLWGDLFSREHNNMTPDGSTLTFSDFPYAYEYPPGTLPALWVQGCDS